MRKKFSVADLEKMRRQSTPIVFYTKLTYLLGRGVRMPLPLVTQAFKDAVKEAQEQS